MASGHLGLVDPLCEPGSNGRRKNLRASLQSQVAYCGTLRQSGQAHAITRVLTHACSDSRMLITANTADYVLSQNMNHSMFTEPLKSRLPLTIYVQSLRMF